LNLVANIPATLPATVQGDPEKLPRLVENLLGITLALTEEGEVHLDADVGQQKGIPPHLELHFCNTGPGISHAQQAALFDALACSGEAPPDDLDATGRALFIARRLAKSMGGELVLQTPRGENFCWLVAVSMLQELGFEVTVANEGSSALKLAKERSFDLILMDCHMPEMDGFATSRTIREWEQKEGRPATPIIALTADIHPGIRRRTQRRKRVPCSTKNAWNHCDR